MYMNNNPYLPYQPKQSNSILWVQGEAGAKSFIVGAGQSVLLMDSENDKFYIKSADMNGMPMLRTFTYTEETPVNAPNLRFEGKGKDFITQDELNAKIDDLRREFNERTLSNPKRTKRNDEEV